MLSPVFAADITKNNLGSDTFTVTVSYNDSGDLLQTSNLYILYDTTVFSLNTTSFQIAQQFGNINNNSRISTTSVTQDAVGSMQGTLPTANWPEEDRPIDSVYGCRVAVLLTNQTDQKGEVFSLSFTVKQNATPGEYGFTVYHTGRTWTTSPATIEVGNGGGSDSPYTITPTGGTSAAVGTPFSVDVTLTADPPESTYASAQAELTYLPNLVKPDLESVTPDLATVSEKSDDEPGTLTVTYGPSSGDTVGQGASLATIPFMPIDEGTAKFNVSEGATVSLTGDPSDGVAAAFGKELEVIIAAGSSQPTVTTDVSYEGAPNGYALLTYEADKTENGYTYDGEPMYWSSKLNAYLYIVESDEFDAIKIQPGTSPADAKELAYDGNLNGGEVRVSDAQIVYDIIAGHANYNTLDGLGVEARLAADVNGDGSVDQDDIDAILNIIHKK
jgi:hypothetical protein